MGEVGFFLLCTLVLPVLINKSTEGARFDWVKPWLRELWTAVFVLLSVYLLSQEGTRGLLMKAHLLMPGLRGYAICALCGAMALCAYWWFTGRITPSASRANRSVIALSIPPVQWAFPAPIVYGVPLSTKQLNATSGVPGAFAYNPDAGFILPVGTHDLTTRFTPTDGAKYRSADITVKLVVNPAPPLPPPKPQAVTPSGLSPAVAEDPDIRLLKDAVEETNECAAFLNKSAMPIYEKAKADIASHDKFARPSDRSGFNAWTIGVANTNIIKLYNQAYRDEFKSVGIQLMRKEPEKQEPYTEWDNPDGISDVMAVCRELSSLTVAYISEECRDGKLSINEGWAYLVNIKSDRSMLNCATPPQ